MPKMRKKADLPTKICAACGLPFAWRKKWAANWSDVKFCSDRCRNTKPESRTTAAVKLPVDTRLNKSKFPI